MRDNLALHKHPVRKNPERKNTETHKNSEHIHKSRTYVIIPKLPVRSHQRWLLTGKASFWSTEMREKALSSVSGKGTKLGDHCPKVRLSQDRMPIEPLTQQQSWVRGKGLSSLAGGEGKGLSLLPQLS